VTALPPGIDFGRDREPAAWIEKHASIAEDLFGFLVVICDECEPSIVERPDTLSDADDAALAHDRGHYQREVDRHAAADLERVRRTEGL